MSIVDDLLEELEQDLPRVSREALSQRGAAGHPAVSAAARQRLVEAWEHLCAGEHGVALLYAFREQAEAILGPVERRERLRSEVSAMLDELDDDNVAALLSTHQVAAMLRPPVGAAPA